MTDYYTASKINNNITATTAEERRRFYESVSDKALMAYRDANEYRLLHNTRIGNRPRVRAHEAALKQIRAEMAARGLL